MNHGSPLTCLSFPALGRQKPLLLTPFSRPGATIVFSLLPFGGVCGIPKVNLHEYVEKNRLPCIILLGEEKISFLSHFVPRLVAAVLEIQSPSCQRERERREREKKKRERGSKGKIKGVLLWDGVVLFLLPPTATAARGSPLPLYSFL